MLLLLALQAATAAVPAAPAAAAVPERFSILAPLPTVPCRNHLPDDDIVVCARQETERLPPSANRDPPDRPMPSNPNLDGAGALAAQRPVCATLQGGCQVGMDVFGAGTALVRLVQKAVSPDSCCEDPGEATNPFALAGEAIGGIKKLVAKKVDKSNRVAIPLETAAPVGRLEP